MILGKFALIATLRNQAGRPERAPVSLYNVILMTLFEVTDAKNMAMRVGSVLR